MRRRIGVFTATRAEYGLLRPVLVALRESRGLEPVVIVAGSHLSPMHGATVSEIEADGIVAATRLPVWPEGDGALDAAVAMGRTVEAVAVAAVDLKLDALMVLGDRSETLGAAAAAVVLALPIIHLEGGHVTAGAIDDAMRHAVTKLAALHFTAHEDYRRRLIRMGESPDRVFVVGATGAAGVLAARDADLSAVSADVGFDLSPGFLLLTWQPETLTPDLDGRRFDALLAALDQRPDLKVLVTLPNADAGGDIIRERISVWSADRAERVAVRESLGRSRYLRAVSASAAVIGNSSSGVLEAPLIGTPSVNIGDRQDGRRRTVSVIDCALETTAIVAALTKATSPEFRRLAREAAPGPDDPEVDGRAAERIVAILEQTNFVNLARKPFVDEA